MGLNYNSQPGTGEQEHLTEKEVDLHIVFKILKFSGQEKNLIKGTRIFDAMCIPNFMFFQSHPGILLLHFLNKHDQMLN